MSRLVPVGALVGRGIVIVDVLYGLEECFGGGESLGQGVQKVTCRGVACVISHRGDGERQVALYQNGGSPPLRPGVVSSGIRSEYWGTD